MLGYGHVWSRLKVESDRVFSASGVSLPGAYALIAVAPTTMLVFQRSHHPLSLSSSCYWEIRPADGHFLPMYVRLGTS